MTSLTGMDVRLATDDAFERLGMAIDELETGGHLHDEYLSASNKQVQVARTYLWLLGYLKKDNGKATTDADYEAAVVSFHVELGRQAPGPRGAQLDAESWGALVELVAFAQGPAHAVWLANPNAASAMRRAVHLRLFSYGLITRPPQREPSVFSADSKDGRRLLQALRDFALVTWRLRLSDQPLSGQIDDETVNLLFSHTRLVESLRPQGEGFQVFSDHPVFATQASAAKKTLKAFIGNLALVELWLLGYEVRPGNFRPDGPHGDERTGTLYKGLNDFAKDRNLPQAGKRNIAAGSWFFNEARSILAAQADDDAVDEAQIDAVLADQKQMAAVEKAYASLGARIIDGARRAFGWIIGQMRRAARVMKQLVRNVARAINAGAVAVYGHLRDVIRVVELGFNYVVRTPVGGSHADRVYLHKGLDFDFAQIINSRASDTEVDDFYVRLDLRVEAMTLGGRIIGQLWHLVRQVLSSTHAVLGWLGMIMVLVKLGNWLRGSVAIARQSSQLIERFRALQPV